VPGTGRAAAVAGAETSGRRAIGVTTFSAATMLLRMVNTL